MIATTFARENNIPFLGICLGFQLAVIEFSRNVLNLKGADSSEFDPKSPHPVIDLLPEQKGIKDMGATMRLGANKIKLAKGSKAHELYKKRTISERHRHRYEVNLDYIEQIEKGGMKFTGKSMDGIRMEVAELKGHPHFMATQFHPEFKSRPSKPSRTHLGLVEAALKHHNKGKKVNKTPKSKPKKKKK